MDSKYGLHLLFGIKLFGVGHRSLSEHQSAVVFFLFLFVFHFLGLFTIEIDGEGRPAFLYTVLSCCTTY